MKLKDKKIQIWKYIEDTNENGFYVEEWQPIHEGSLWAHYRHLSGTEIFASAMELPTEDAVFTINWRDDLDASMVVKYRGKYYDITRIDDFEGYKKDITIYANYNPVKYSEIEGGGDDPGGWDDDWDWDKEIEYDDNGFPIYP